LTSILPERERQGLLSPFAIAVLPTPQGEHCNPLTPLTVTKHKVPPQGRAKENYLTMTTEELPKLPDRDVLRALYAEAINELNQPRGGRLTTDFYAKTGAAVFEACYLALSDSCKGTNGPRRGHVVSAPAGGGKTSFSYAFMTALTRHADSNPKAPYGCIFVVDQIKKADEAYRELNELMPSKVAVWFTEHDRGCKTRTKVPSPAAEFTQDELRNYPVIVFTHAFYN